MRARPATDIEGRKPSGRLSARSPAPLTAEEVGLLRHHHLARAQYWSFQDRHGVEKWLKQIHAIQDFWVSEMIRRKRRLLDATVAGAVRNRFCGPDGDQDTPGIVFVVMTELMSRPGLIHLVKFRNRWTDRPWPLRDPAPRRSVRRTRRKGRGAPRR